MKEVGQLKATLGLDKSKYEAGMKDAGKQGNWFASIMKRLGGIIAGAFAVSKIIQFGKAIFQSYQGQKEAEIKLATIMRERMGLGQEAVKDLARQADAYQRIGVIADDVQLAGVQQLAMFVKQKESLDKMLPAMNNMLAQQKGFNATSQDAITIATMMGKAMSGQLTFLQRQGIVLTANQEKLMKEGNELERASLLAEIITGRVGNMNEELGKTDLGKIQRWRNTWDDFRELLGSKLVPILGNIAEWGIKTIPKIEDGFRWIAQRVVSVINYFIDLYNESTAFRAIIEGIKFTFKTTFGFIKLQIQNTVDAFIGLGTILKDVFTGNWKEIGTHAKEAFEAMKENGKEFADDTAENWDKMMENITSKPHIQYVELRVRGEGGVPETKTTKRGPTEPAPGKVAPKGYAVTTGTELVGLSQMRNEDEIFMMIKKHLYELNNEMLATHELTGMVFDGLADSMYRAFNETGNILENFGRFFAEFIKQMIFKLVAATIAAAALAFVISLITGGGAAGAGVGVMASFGKNFKNLFTQFGGFSFQHGGSVPPGFPNDTFPAMLSSGETVLTPRQLSGLGSSNVKFEFEEIGIRNDTIYLAVKEAERKRKNNF